MSVLRRYQRSLLSSLNHDRDINGGRAVLAGQQTLLRSLLMLTDISLTFSANRALLGFMRLSYVLKRQMEQQGIELKMSDDLRGMRAEVNNVKPRLVNVSAPSTPQNQIARSNDELELVSAHRVDTSSSLTSSQLFASASDEPIERAITPTYAYGTRHLGAISEEKRISQSLRLSSVSTIGKKLKGLQPPLLGQVSQALLTLSDDGWVQERHRSGRRHRQQRAPRRLGSKGVPSMSSTPLQVSLQSSQRLIPQDERKEVPRPRTLEYYEPGRVNGSLIVEPNGNAHERSPVSTVSNQSKRHSISSRVKLIFTDLGLVNSPRHLVHTLDALSTVLNTLGTEMNLVTLRELRLLLFLKKFRRLLTSLTVEDSSLRSVKGGLIHGNKYKINLVPYNVFARGVPKQKFWS